MDDIVCSCALISCKWCCCSAVRLGICCFNTAPAVAHTAGVTKWNCDEGAWGGFGEHEEVGSCSFWSTTGWGITWGICTWIGWGCVCCCGAWASGWDGCGEPPIELCIIKSGGIEEGVHAREGAWDWDGGCAWGWDGGRDCGGWGDWIWIRGEAWDGCGLSDRVGVTLWVATDWDGEALWIFKACCWCAADETWRLGNEREAHINYFLIKETQNCT